MLGVNDLVLIDGGGRLHSYWSDLTRVRGRLTHSGLLHNAHLRSLRHSLCPRQYSPINSSRFGMLFEMLRLRPSELPRTGLSRGPPTRPPEQC